jgi:hypothetical protein
VLSHLLQRRPPPDLLLLRRLQHRADCPQLLERRNRRQPLPQVPRTVLVRCCHRLHRRGFHWRRRHRIPHSQVALGAHIVKNARAGALGKGVCGRSVLPVEVRPVRRVREAALLLQAPDANSTVSTHATNGTPARVG